MASGAPVDPARTTAEPPPPASTQLRFTLRDGSPVVVRRIDPGDKDRLQDGLARLSLLSRYRRFMGAPRVLSASELRYLTEVDQRDHLAWIALDPQAPGEPALGVARCIRLAGEPLVAEAAVTVVDSHQGRGLGTLLLGVLAAAARAQGIRALRGYVLASNAPMLRLLEQLGAQAVPGGDAQATWYDVPVPADLAALPDTPLGRCLRDVAPSLG